MYTSRLLGALCEAHADISDQWTRQQLSGDRGEGAGRGRGKRSSVRPSRFERGLPRALACVLGKVSNGATPRLPFPRNRGSSGGGCDTELQGRPGPGAAPS